MLWSWTWSNQLRVAGPILSPSRFFHRHRQLCIIHQSSVDSTCVLVLFSCFLRVHRCPPSFLTHFSPSCSSYVPSSIFFIYLYLYLFFISSICSWADWDRANVLIRVA